MLGALDLVPHLESEIIHTIHKVFSVLLIFREMAGLLIFRKMAGFISRNQTHLKPYKVKMADCLLWIVTLISQKTYNAHFSDCPLAKPSVKLCTYTAEPIRVVGQMHVEVKPYRSALA